MILLISGSREGFKYKEFLTELGNLIDTESVTEVVAGGARGVDYFAKKFAQENGIEYSEFNADWDGEGVKAGILRNQDMANYIKKKSKSGVEVVVVAFRYNLSSGTTHMIRYATSIGLNVLVYDKDDVDMDFN